MAYSEIERRIWLKINLPASTAPSATGRIQITSVALLTLQPRQRTSGTPRILANTLTTTSTVVPPRKRGVSSILVHMYIPCFHSVAVKTKFSYIRPVQQATAGESNVGKISVCVQFLKYLQSTGLSKPLVECFHKRLQGEDDPETTVVCAKRQKLGGSPSSHEQCPSACSGTEGETSAVGTSTNDPGSEPQQETSRSDATELEKDRGCTDVRDKVKRKFLVDMPEDFYQFWEFCKSIDPSHPECELNNSYSFFTVYTVVLLA